MYSSFSSMFQALLFFHSNWPLSNIFLLKLEKQFDSLSQVAAIVHNDFYYLFQEILGLAFQVCIPNLLLLVISTLFLGWLISQVLESLSLLFLCIWICDLHISVKGTSVFLIQAAEHDNFMVFSMLMRRCKISSKQYSLTRLLGKECLGWIIRTPA